eukprot:SAG11_NODE_25680_length_355_cov_1.222656_1_plen_69_part_01
MSRSTSFMRIFAHENGENRKEQSRYKQKQIRLENETEINHFSKNTLARDTIQNTADITDLTLFPLLATT